MKILSLLLAVASSTPAFAKGPQWSLAAIATNPEVVALVSAMEKNRGLRCGDLLENAVTVRRDGYATVLYSCNEYNEAGEPMANVTAIELKGWATADGFDLMRVKFIPLE